LRSLTRAGYASAVATLKRVVYVAACTILYLTAVVVLGLLLWIGWFLFVAFVLQGVGCNGACNGVGRFTGDYWWLIGGGSAAVIALAMLPVYRRLLRDA
jgi:hypothetical protein